MPDVDPPKAVLKLKIDFENGADARLSGKILTQVGHAYSQHCLKLGVGNARLVVQRIEISSLVAVLEGVVELIKGAQVIYDNRELVASFVHEISAVTLTIESGHPGSVPAYMRNLVRALIEPILKGKASMSTVRVENADGAFLEINSNDAAAIDKALTIGEKVLVDNPKYSHRVERTKIADPALVTRATAPIAPTTTTFSPSIANGLNFYGTLVHALDTWYVRPASLNGTMIPADLGTIKQGFDPAATYLVQGDTSYVGGVPYKFIVWSVERQLGSPEQPPPL